MRLEAGLGISADFWLKGQQMYDGYQAREEHREIIANIQERREEYFGNG